MNATRTHTRGRAAIVVAVLLVAGPMVVAAVSAHPYTKTDLARSPPPSSSGSLGPRYGDAVAMGDGHAAVGANLEAVSGRDSAGTVAFFEDGSGWSQVQFVPNPDPGAFDQFGSSVDMDRHWAIVGAHGHDGPQADTGAAYLYQWDSSQGEWIRQVDLHQLAPVASTLQKDDFFGYAVDIQHFPSGKATAVVGAPDNSPSPNGFADRGKAYVFTKPPSGSWALADVIRPAISSPAAPGAFFGSSVDVDLNGNVAVVGAIEDWGPAPIRAGSAYVFHEQASGTWTQDAKLVANVGQAPFNDFGLSVDVDHAASLATRVVVGEPGFPAGQDQGRVHTFALQSGGWSHQQALTRPSGLGSGSNFGIPVDLEPGTLVVGHGGGDHVDVFDWTGSGWVDHPGPPPGGPGGSGFGIAMDYDGGDEMVVGAPTANSWTGSAYVVDGVP